MKIICLYYHLGHDMFSFPREKSAIYGRVSLSTVLVEVQTA